MPGRTISSDKTARPPCHARRHPGSFVVMTHDEGTAAPGGADEVGAAHDALHTGPIATIRHSTLIVLSGPPGAGKSTVAAALAATFPRTVHVHTDDFWHAIVTGGIPPHESAADRQNHVVVEAIVGAATAYARGGYTVVVDGVVGPWMLRHYRDAIARHPELEVHYIVLRPNRAVTLSRAQARTALDALIAEEPIVSLWDQFQDLGELEAHAIDTSTHSPDETVRIVRAAVDTGAYRIAAAESG